MDCDRKSKRKDEAGALILVVVSWKGYLGGIYNLMADLRKIKTGQPCVTVIRMALMKKKPELMFLSRNIEI